MGEDWKHYDVDAYNAWKRRQGRNFRSPPQENYLVAADHIKTILDGKKISWATMCGLAMWCLGSRRDMPDLHICYDDRDFQRVKSKLEADKRVSLPKGLIPLFPVKILVATGPKYKDATCVENVEIEVDLVPAGRNGTPTIDAFRKNQVLLRLNLNGKIDNFRGLNMLYLVKTLLQYCKSQDLAWDPKEDIIFLCRNYASQIEQIRQELDHREVQEMLLSTAFFAKLPAEDQRKCYLTVLNKEPPPLMSVTPPPVPQSGHRASNSAPGPFSKLPLQSHKSTPTPNTSKQPSSAFLSPPLPGKPKSKSAQSPGNPPVNSGTGPRAQSVPTYSSTAESRARYRAISAPNTLNAIVDKGTPTATANTSQPMSIDVRVPQQHTPNAVYSTARAVGIQNGPNFSRPHMVQVQGHTQTHVQAPAHTPMSAQTVGLNAQRSMPNMRAPHKTIPPMPAQVNAIIPPGPRKSYIAPQTGSTVVPPASRAGAHRAQTKPSPQGSPQGSQQNDRARVANLSVDPQGNPVPLPAQVKASLPNQQADKSHNRSMSGLAPNSKPTIVESSPPQPAALRLVGPDGLYKPPENPIQPTRAAPTGARNLPSASGPANRPLIPNQPIFAVELDASPAQQAITRSMSPQELPSDPVVSRQPLPKTSQPTHIAIGPQQSASTSQPQPSVPPEFAHLAHDIVSLLQQPIGASNLAPNQQNELYPRGTLPSSLMAGGATRQRSPSRSPERSPQSQPSSSNIQTNASQYGRYYSPSSSPGNGYTPPFVALASQYKAYTGPVSPPVPAPGNLQKAQEYTMVSPLSATQGPAYTVTTARFSFTKTDNLTGNISSPEKRDSHHSPPKSNMSMNITDSKPTVIGTGAPGYAAFSYLKEEQMPMQGPAHITTQRQQLGDEVWFTTHAGQDQSQTQHQSLQQPQPQLQTQEPATTAPQAPVQWTHPSLLHHTQTQPQPQPQHALTHQNMSVYDSPTTSLHTRNTSHGSDKLAQEYQAELPRFGEMGYGSGSGYSSGEEVTPTKNEERKVDEIHVSKPQDGWKRESKDGKAMGNGEGNGNGGKRISELYEFIDFT